MKRYFNKKGLDYIDWTMSLGIFVIAIIALFTFLKPGVQPAYEGNNLLLTVEQNLFRETQTTVKETPVFIKELDDLYGANLQATVIVKINSGWQFREVSDPPVGQPFEPTAVRTREVEWNCHAGSCKGNFIVKWTAQQQNPSEPILELDCTPSNQAMCDAQLGATTTVEGLDEGLLQQLKTDGYEKVKARWKFPQEKNFAISIDAVKLIGGEEPVNQGTIVVKEMPYWSIRAAKQSPIVINLRVW